MLVVPIVPIDELYAKCSIGLPYRAKAQEKVLAFVKYITSNGAGPSRQRLHPVLHVPRRRGQPAYSRLRAKAARRLPGSVWPVHEVFF